MDLRRVVAFALGLLLAAVPVGGALSGSPRGDADALASPARTSKADEDGKGTKVHDEDHTTSTSTPPTDTAPTVSAPTTSTATPPPPAPPPPPTEALPPPTAPVAGRSVTLSPGRGTVSVRPPGAATAVPLDAAAQLPTGTLIDTTQGAVYLSSVKGPGTTQTGRFSGGVFIVRQARSSRPVTEIVLARGSFAACPAVAARSGLVASAAATSSRRRVVRRLWGSDRHGRFTTRGRVSAAAVRGTRWLTEDRCDGTRTVVREGAVEVRDRRTGRRFVVRAGHSHLARR